MDVDHPGSSSNPARPSTAPASNTTNRKTSQSNASRSGSVSKSKPPPAAAPVVNVDEEDDDEDEVQVQPIKTSKGKEKPPSAPGTAAARPPSRAPSVARSVPRANGHASEAGGGQHSSSRPPSRSAQRVERSQEEWEEILGNMREQVSKWEAKYIDLAKLRKTDEEEALERFQAQAEERIAALQKENEALLRREPLLEHLTRPNRRNPLELLTEASLNSRLRQSSDQISELQAQLLASQNELSGCKKELATFKKENEMLQHDIQQEIRQNKLLTEENRKLKQAALATPQPTGIVDDSYPPRNPRYEAAIIMYEDLSKVLIVDCQPANDKGFEMDCLIKHPHDKDIVFRFKLRDIEDPMKPDSQEWWYMFTPSEANLQYWNKDELSHFATMFRIPRHQTTDLLLQVLEIIGYDVNRDEEEGDETEVSIAVD
ncbi:hypothetical protein DL93DRAFT_2225011 [Clavulina sp. PMI_390]|nr:hypothetical protein DL93DRAFT_2225011 [Clavulina sp. PMI_390]